MTSKYASLPDIDNAQDIYETADVPDEILNNDEVDSDAEISTAKQQRDRTMLDHDDIDHARTNIGEARKRFDLAANSVTSRRLPSTSVYTMHPSSARHRSGPAAGSDEKETNLERLRRLRSEVEELEEDVKRDQDENDSQEAALGSMEDGDSRKGKGRGKQVSPAIILQQLQLLRGDLSQLSVKEVDSAFTMSGNGEKEATESTELSRKVQASSSLLSSLHAPKGTGTSESGARSDTGDGASSVGERKVATEGELEARLTEMERIIGASEADVDESSTQSPPILQTLGRLDHLLTLLSQPRHLDSISRRVKVLVTDLERLHDSRKKLGDTRPLSVALSGGMTAVVGDSSAVHSLSPATDGSAAIAPDTLQKIDALFALLPRLDPLLPLTPRLLSRLRSLSSLHASAATFDSTLSGVREEVRRLGEGESGLREVLEGLEASMAENDAKVKGNLSGLEERIGRLIERMG